MTRSEIIARFREENSEITARVITDAVLNSWLKQGNLDFCIKTRCIVDQAGTTIETEEDDTYYDLTSKITNFYDIDNFPASGVTYNNRRLDKKTMVQLDMESTLWRERPSGTPKAWFRRGKYLYLDRPVGSAEEDIIVYAVLLPDDFITDVAPFNSLQHLEAFHYALVLYLNMRAKGKIGKREDAVKAMAEYLDYVRWTKSEIGGGKYGPRFYRPR